MISSRPKVLMRDGLWGVIWQYEDGSTTKWSWAYASLPDAYKAAYIAATMIRTAVNGRYSN